MFINLHYGQLWWYGGIPARDDEPAKVNAWILQRLGLQAESTESGDAVARQGAELRHHGCNRARRVADPARHLTRKPVARRGLRHRARDVTRNHLSIR